MAHQEVPDFEMLLDESQRVAELALLLGISLDLAVFESMDLVEEAAYKGLHSLTDDVDPLVD